MGSPDGYTVVVIVGVGPVTPVAAELMLVPEVEIAGGIDRVRPGIIENGAK